MIKSFKNLLMKDLEPRYMQKVYELDKVMFVPHYLHNSFVGPGYGISTVKIFSEEELVEMGATMTMYPLWAGGTNRSIKQLEKKYGGKESVKKVSNESITEEGSRSKTNN